MLLSVIEGRIIRCEKNIQLILILTIYNHTKTILLTITNIIVFKRFISII